MYNHAVGYLLLIHTQIEQVEQVRCILLRYSLVGTVTVRILSILQEKIT